MDYLIIRADNYEVCKNAEKEFKNYFDADTDLIYADEKTTSGIFYKPDWSPDLFNDLNFFGGVIAVRKDLCDTNVDDKMSAYDFEHFAKSVISKCDWKKIKHIGKILSTRKDDYQIDSIKPQTYKLDDTPFVSIIIPSKDNFDIFKKCADSIKSISSYSNYEIILVDNGSSDENKNKLEKYCLQNNISYLYEKMEFNFARMCNLGAENSKGDFLLFLNDDIEIIQRDWLEILLGQAKHKYTGAVGAKLLYPDGETIQHVGVINLGLGPSHVLSGKSDKESYYFGRNRLTYNYSAVTAALLLVERKKFDEINGFDENFKVTYNDIDLCFKLKEAGYYNVVRNDVKALHYESFSRGQDTVDQAKMTRLIEERTKLWLKHPQFNKGQDPYYNENLAPDYTDFRIREEKTSMDISRCLGELTNVEKLDAGFTCVVDPVIYEEEYLIHGWFYWKDDKSMEKVKPGVLLFDENNKVLLYEAIKVEREDVAKANNFGCIRCGFSARIKKDDIMLTAREYKIGLFLQLPLFRKKARKSDVTLKNLCFSAK